MTFLRDLSSGVTTAPILGGTINASTAVKANAVVKIATGLLTALTDNEGAITTLEGVMLEDAAVNATNVPYIAINPNQLWELPYIGTNAPTVGTDYDLDVAVAGVVQVDEDDETNPKVIVISVDTDRTTCVVRFLATVCDRITV